MEIIIILAVIIIGFGIIKKIKSIRNLNKSTQNFEDYLNSLPNSGPDVKLNKYSWGDFSSRKTKKDGTYDKRYKK